MRRFSSTPALRQSPFPSGKAKNSWRIQIVRNEIFGATFSKCRYLSFFLPSRYFTSPVEKIMSLFFFCWGSKLANLLCRRSLARHVTSPRSWAGVRDVTSQTTSAYKRLQTCERKGKFCSTHHLKAVILGRMNPRPSSAKAHAGCPLTF